ncbi:MAG: SagB family peptide dehydrogenase [Sedimentisphaerales bacterium]|nr:SagB family peptide dehydrogenase [Sedimentisphaerales bacterium]
MMHPNIIRKACFLIIISIVSLPVFVSTASSEAPKRVRPGMKVIQLPTPVAKGSATLEEAISSRRSIRQFADKPLDFVQMGQLCWAGQGVTDKLRNLRAAPSAGAIYPIELYLVTLKGLFVYRPEEHLLEQVSTADLRKPLASAAQGQDWLAEAPCSIVIAGSVRKVAAKYGNKAMRFMLLEAGCVAENIQLQGIAMGLATVAVGAFDSKTVHKICQLSGELEPLLIVCIAYPLVKLEEPNQAEKPASEVKKAVLIVPGADFRDEEFFETQRILNNAGIITVVAGPKIGPLRGASGGIVASELTLDRVSVDDFEAVVFIGGPGASEYFENKTTFSIASEAAAKRKVLAAIDNAPTILANAGVLRNIRATGFLTQRESIKKGGAQYTGAPVEKDMLIITASGPLAVVPFAQTIVAALQKI